MDSATGSAALRFSQTTLEELEALCDFIDEQPPGPEWFTVRDVADHRYDGNRDQAAYYLDKSLRAGSLELRRYKGLRYYRIHAKTDETETTETDAAGQTAKDEQAAA